MKIIVATTLISSVLLLGACYPHVQIREEIRSFAQARSCCVRLVEIPSSGTLDLIESHEFTSESVFFDFGDGAGARPVIRFEIADKHVSYFIRSVATPRFGKSMSGRGLDLFYVGLEAHFLGVDGNTFHKARFADPRIRETGATGEMVMFSWIQIPPGARSLVLAALPTSQASSEQPVSHSGMASMAGSTYIRVPGQTRQTSYNWSLLGSFGLEVSLRP